MAVNSSSDGSTILFGANAPADAEYLRPASGRRFILGAVARYPRLNRYGVELWEGDVIDAALLSTMMRVMQARFHASLNFEPNSDQREQAAKTAGLPTISVDQAYGRRQQLVLNPGYATGRLALVNDAVHLVRRQGWAAY